MRILVTGGSSGLGRAIVEILAQNPDNEVFFTYCRKEDDAKDFAGFYGNVSCLKVDFTSAESVDRFVESISAMGLDALVNNAWVGKPTGTYFHKTDCEDYTKAFQYNVLPLVKISQACITKFRKQKHGSIVTVLTSYLLDLPPMGYSVYTATKAYIEQLSKCWSKENARFGITANCVSPEYMQTTFADVDERVLEQMVHDHPLKRLLQPEEVAKVVTMLLDVSNQVNGINIPVNAAQHVIK